MPKVDIVRVNGIKVDYNGKAKRSRTLCPLKFTLESNWDCEGAVCAWWVDDGCVIAQIVREHGSYKLTNVESLDE